MSEDVAKLVREARENYAQAAREGILEVPIGMLAVAQFVPQLCDALEEREREVERLRRIAYGAQEAPEIRELAQENERLREVLRGCEIYFAKGVEFDPGSAADEEMLRLVREALAAREREERG